MNDSILLGLKGFWFVIGAGVLHTTSMIAQAVAEPTEIVKGIESLGPQGLLFLGIVYLYRANQTLQAEIKKMHEDHANASKAYFDLLQKQVQESNDSRDRLYTEIRGSLIK